MFWRIPSTKNLIMKLIRTHVARLPKAGARVRQSGKCRSITVSGALPIGPYLASGPYGKGPDPRASNSGNLLDIALQQILGVESSHCRISLNPDRAIIRWKVSCLSRQGNVTPRAVQAVIETLLRLEALSYATATNEQTDQHAAEVDPEWCLE